MSILADIASWHQPPPIHINKNIQKSHYKKSSKFARHLKESSRNSEPRMVGGSLLDWSLAAPTNWKRLIIENWLCVGSFFMLYGSSGRPRKDLHPKRIPHTPLFRANDNESGYQVEDNEARLAVYSVYIFIHHIITWYPHTSLKQKTFHIQSKLSETANTCNEYLHSLPFSHALMAAQPAISTDSLNISESNNLGTRDWNHQSAWCQCPCANISAIVATSIAWTMEVSAARPVPVVSAK